MPVQRSVTVRSAEIEHGVELVEDQFVDLGGCERVDSLTVVMAVADDQGAVCRLHGDEMHAVLERRGLLRGETVLQGTRLGQLGVAQIAHEAEIGHHRRPEARTRGRLDAHHVQLARREIVRGDSLGEEGQEVVASTHDRAFCVNRAARRLDGGRAHLIHQRRAQKGDAM